MEVLYFAYGSCMDEIDFKRTVGEFKTLGSATLMNYRLAFSLYGKSRGGGVADVIPSAGEEVQGVLYSFDSKWLEHLDEREGVPDKVYERIEVEVSHNGKNIKCYTYQVVEKEDQEIAPALPYLQLMRNGLEKHAQKEYLNQFIVKIKQQFNLEIR